MTPIAAIQAATVNPADLGWSDKVGTLEPGKFADIIAVDGAPPKTAPPSSMSTSS